jgi:hypothetical protein
VRVAAICVIPPGGEPLVRPNPKNQAYNASHRNLCCAALRTSRRYGLSVFTARLCIQPQVLVEGLVHDAKGRWSLLSLPPRNVRLCVLPRHAVARRVDGGDKRGAIPHRHEVALTNGRRRLAASRYPRRRSLHSRFNIA